MRNHKLARGLPPVRLLVMLTVATWLAYSSAPPLVAQDASDARAGNARNAAPAQDAEPRAESPTPPPGNDGDDQGSWLGVWIEPTPNNAAGVRVLAVDPNGPAARAGLRAGDYVLTFGGQDVTDPQQLITKIRQLDPGAQTELKIWRGQETQTLTVQLGNQGQQRGTTQRRGFRGQTADPTAWLGVTLAERDDMQGALVSDVFPSGPAARAGVREGDRIVGVNTKTVSDSDQLIAAIESLKPGDQATLTVRRDDQSLEITSTLGNRDDFLAPLFDDQENGQGFMDQFDEFSRIPDHAMMLEQHRHFSTQHERIEQLLYQALDELRALRADVEQLKKPSGNETR